MNCFKIFFFSILHTELIDQHTILHKELVIDQHRLTTYYLQEEEIFSF